MKRFTMVGLLLLCCGCTSLKGMKPEDLTVQPKSPASVRVRVEYVPKEDPDEPGMRKFLTGDIRVIPLSPSDVAEALRESLVSSGLFARVDDGDSADYQLLVHVLNYKVEVDAREWLLLQTKGVGTMTADWQLRRRGDPAPVFDEWITSAAEASLFEAVQWPQKGALVRERMVRDNIRQGIEHLAVKDRQP